MVHQLISHVLQIKEQACQEELELDQASISPAVSPIQAFKNEYQAAEAAERRRRGMKKKQQSCQTQ